MERERLNDGGVRNMRNNTESPQEQNFHSHKSEESTKKGLLRNILIYLHDLVYLFGILLLIFLLCFRVVVVSGSSMNKTLINGDYLFLLSNTFYKTPKQGDIVVASKNSFENGEPIVKRVIATEGQTVDINFTTGAVYVDGIKLEESYISTATTRPEGVVFPLYVDEGCLFVMGDNRAISHDSRSPDIGLIDRREIIGKAIFLFLPGPVDDSGRRDFTRIGVLS